MFITTAKMLQVRTLDEDTIHNEPTRTHLVVELYECSHAIMGLTNDRDNILWYAKTDEYSPEEGSTNGLVRLGKFDEEYVQRNSFLSRRIL